MNHCLHLTKPANSKQVVSKPANSKQVVSKPANSTARNGTCKVGRMDTAMAKSNHKKTYTPEDMSSKDSVLEDQFIGGPDNKYDDRVQKLIDVGKEKGYLLFDEVSDLLPPEIGASAEDLDYLFSEFA